MKNVASTVAMKVAHKLAKQFSKMSFSNALRHAWLLVKRSLKAAQAFLSGAYKVEVVKVGTDFGAVKALKFAAKGFIGAIKATFGKAPAITVTPWGKFL